MGVGFSHKQRRQEGRGPDAGLGQSGWKAPWLCAGVRDGGAVCRGDGAREGHREKDGGGKGRQGMRLGAGKDESLEFSGQ